MLENLCILIVDDDEDARDLLEIFLRDLGVYVVTAGTPREAMAALCLVRIDAAILKATLPEATAAMLLGRIRAAGYDAPAIIVSRFGVTREAEAAFDGVLVEPVDPSALEALLVRITGARRPALASARAGSASLLH